MSDDHYRSIRSPAPIKTYFIDLQASPFGDMAYRLTGPDGYVKQKNIHSGFEVLQVWNDRGYVLIDDTLYPMAKGYVYFINGNEPHSTNPLRKETYTRSKIVFSPGYLWDRLDALGMADLLRVFYRSPEPDSRIFRLSGEQAAVIDRIFQEMNLYPFKDKNTREAYLAIQLMKLLLLIQSFSQPDHRADSPSPGNVHVRRMIAHIKDNFSNFDLGILCSQIHISKSYACRVFKRITGKTIHEYVKACRVSHAKMCLLTTDDPVSKIGADSGYPSFSLFSQAFREVTGMTPSDYRKAASRPLSL